MSIDDFTFCIPEYNTPEILELNLKSLVFHHRNVPIKLMISLNSTNDNDLPLLEKNNIPFFKNPGSTHSPSIQDMMGRCKTRYFIHLDSDVLFKRSILDLITLFKKHECVVMGEHQSSRGGYNLKDRIAPYFTIIDLEKIKENNIVWHDDKIIDESNSRGFFNNIPLQNNLGGIYYDNGSILFEQCAKKNLKIGKINGIIGKYVYTVESLSWAESSKVPGYIQLGKQRKADFLREAEPYRNVDIKDRFIHW